MLKLLTNGKTYSASVVIEHIQKSNAGTMRVVCMITYKYGSANFNYHSYLSFESAKRAIFNLNHDVLFDRSASYIDQTVVNNG